MRKIPVLDIILPILSPHSLTTGKTRSFASGANHAPIKRKQAA